MWIVMTVAMMLPSVAPALWRFRRSVGGCDATRPALLTTLVGVGYFSVWTLLGAVVFPLGVAITEAVTHEPAASIAVGAVVLSAGLLQRTAWKARHLACCREEHWLGAASSSVSGAAWRHGVRLGVHCCFSCVAPMAILLALGVMELRAMIVVTAAVTVERLAPASERVARVTATIAIVAGAWLILRAASVG
jgi:predicted metal-binding membrane protein